MPSFIEYLYKGYLQRDIKIILTRLSALATLLSEVKLTMTVDLNQILTNQQNIQAAITQLITTATKTLQDLQAEITVLQGQGADTTTLQSIADSQQASLDSLSQLQTSTSAADPVVASLIEAHRSLLGEHQRHLELLENMELPGTHETEDGRVVSDQYGEELPANNFPLSVPAPSAHTTYATTECEESARGVKTIAKKDGTSVTVTPDGEVVSKHERPKNFSV